jgi:hypothetical protein
LPREELRAFVLSERNFRIKPYLGMRERFFLNDFPRSLAFWIVWM